MTLIEAAKQALEALEEAHPKPYNESVILHVEAITALRTAIAEAEKQEPFGYFQYAPHFDAWVQNRDEDKGVAFYTTPPAAQRQWVGLTDEEIDDIWNRYCDEMGEASINDAYDIARAIEAAHGITGEKNT
jgi:hypothetical protein